MVAQDRDKPCPYGKMDKFPGFSDQETFTQVPDSFFRKLLNEIDEADELKVTLYAIWRMAHMEGHTRFLRAQDFAEIVPDPASALEKAVSRGSLIGVEKKGKFFFLNSPRGRAVADSFAKDQWEPGDAPSVAPRERPNVFKLYEENIGPLTPLLADALKDAEQTYKEEWVAEAIEIAVKNNKRNWKYVEAILKRWKVEGHAKKQDRRDAQESSRRYSEGEFAEYLKGD
jgi:DNA replication protein